MLAALVIIISKGKQTKTPAQVQKEASVLDGMRLFLAMLNGAFTVFASTCSSCSIAVLFMEIESLHRL